MSKTFHTKPVAEDGALKVTVPVLVVTVTLAGDPAMVPKPAYRWTQ